MCLCKLQLYLEILKDLFTCLGIIAAGIWAVYIFIRQRENQPRIEMSADIIFHGKMDGWWITELVTYIENKGKVQHKLYNLDFDLASINKGDSVDLAPQFGGQALFPNLISKGSFKRADMEYFFIEPGVKGKYSYLTRVPENAEIIVLHAWFDYEKISKVHGSEKTAIVPDFLESTKIISNPV